MKTCKEIKREYDAAWMALRRKFELDIREATRREFPVGTLVQFPHGAKQLEGVVTGHGDYDFNWEKVKIRTKTKAIWDKPSWELTVVPPPPPKETTTERLKRERV